MPGERIGHEFWHADGEHVGYHGSRPDGLRIIGHVRFDDIECHDAVSPYYVQHVHCNTPDRMVGDGSQGGAFVRLFQRNGCGYGEPRALCEHRCAAHFQQAHVHPRFSPDGETVVFTSNRTGYCQVYEVRVPPIESLPVIDVAREG